MEARAYAPGHITSFFAIHADPSLPPAQRGSRGSGFCIESGVTATLRTEGKKRAAPTSRSPDLLPFELVVIDNGQPIAHPETTEKAMRELVRRAGRNAIFPERVRLENQYTLPLGAGFGVSGACALSATIAANEAMGLGLDRSECVAAAHAGEVEALSGLGDVGAQSLGGFEIRVREGPPPTGQVLVFDVPPAEVLLVSFGPRRTREFLSNPKDKDRLNRTGTNCLEKLLSAPALDHCIRLGRSFAETLGLVSPRAGELMRLIDPSGLASVAMLGDSVFAIAPPEAADLARRRAKNAFVDVTRLTPTGAHLL